MSESDKIYEVTAEHIARALMEDDKGLQELNSMLNEEQQELLAQCAGMLVAVGIHTAQGLAPRASGRKPTHDIELYLQGAADANEMNKEG